MKTAIKSGEKVHEILPLGSLLEFEVVNSRGVNTGRAFARISGHKHSRGNDTFEIWHLTSSDSKYNEWAAENLNGEDAHLLHLCKKVNEKGECTHRPKTGNKGLMHVKTWRAASFQCMLDQEYAYNAGLGQFTVELERLLKAQAGLDEEEQFDTDLQDWEDPGQEKAEAMAASKEEEARKRALAVAASKSAPPKKDDGVDQKATRKAAVEAAAVMASGEPRLVPLQQ